MSGNVRDMISETSNERLCFAYAELEQSRAEGKPIEDIKQLDHIEDKYKKGDVNREELVEERMEEEGIDPEAIEDEYDEYGVPRSPYYRPH